MPILDDGTFTSYGGQTGTSTPIQRLIAYGIAEEQAGQYIGTFLTPTVVTGTFLWPYPDNRLILKESDLRSIRAVWAVTHNEFDNSIASYTGTGLIVSHKNSVLAVYPGTLAPCEPELVSVAYEAGLSPGTITGSYSYMAALVILAQIYLQQIMNQLTPQGGAVTAQQIKSWSSMTHSETYVDGVKTNTFFGETPAALLAANLLSPLVWYRGLKLP